MGNTHGFPKKHNLLFFVLSQIQKCNFFKLTVLFHCCFSLLFNTCGTSQDSESIFMPIPLTLIATLEEGNRAGVIIILIIQMRKLNREKALDPSCGTWKQTQGQDHNLAFCSVQGSWPLCLSRTILFLILAELDSIQVCIYQIFDSEFKKKIQSNVHFLPLLL